MNAAASLWIIGVVCLVGALVGQAIKIAGNELPTLTSRYTRITLAIIGVLALTLGGITFSAANTQIDTSGTEPAGGQTAAPTQPVSTPTTPMEWSNNLKWSDFMCIDFETCAVGDVNGDQRDDIIAFVKASAPEPHRNDVVVALSDGTKFGSPVTWSDFMCIDFETCAVGDVNGDQRDDIIAFVKASAPEPRRNDIWIALSAKR